MALPTPHLEKLNATLANDKLPVEDKRRIVKSAVSVHVPPLPRRKLN